MKKRIMMVLLLCVFVAFSLTVCSAYAAVTKSSVSVNFFVDNVLYSFYVVQTSASSIRITLPSTPSKSGFTFEGWYSDRVPSVQITSTGFYSLSTYCISGLGSIDYDFDINAHFSAPSYTLSVTGQNPLDNTWLCDWSIVWAPGSTITSSVSSYVSIVPSSDTRSCVVSLLQDFGSNVVILTVSVRGYPDIKATCNITVGD